MSIIIAEDSEASNLDVAWKSDFLEVNVGELYSTTQSESIHEVRVRTEEF